MFSLDQLTRMQEDAASKAMEDRHRFDPIYEIVEKYVKKNKLILGGNISIKMAIGDPKTQDDFYYDIYSDHPVKEAFNLANLIAEVTEAIYVRTEIYGKELMIKIQERPIVKIIGLPKNMKNIIQPEYINGIYYIPADYHLIETYRILYTPMVDEWEKYIEYEKELYGWIKKEFDVNKARFIGGADSPDVIREQLKRNLLEHLNSRNDIILVGLEACSSFLPNMKYSNKTLDILTTMPVIKELVSWINKSTKLPASYKSNSMQLLADFRLSKTTIYITYQSKKIPVLYAYDCLEYDVVPFNKNNNGCQIGNLFVIMRFLLLDAWSIKTIRSSGGIDEKFAKNRISEIYQIYFELRDKLKLVDENIQSNINNVWGVFQPIENYIGNYFSDMRAKKAIIKEQDFTPDYLPIRFFKQHGFYQEI